MPMPQQTAGYLLGIDTGSSKTHALIVDFEGNVVGFGESGSGNYEVVGLEGMRYSLQKATEIALTAGQINKNQIRGMGFGLSGYDWPSEKQTMIKAIDSLGIACPYQYVNDVLLGLIIGSAEGWGIVVDAGTGNNVRGRDKAGREGRITGNSIRSGEFGGAGEMVWCAAIAAIRAWTQRGPKTCLTQMLMDYTEIEDESAMIEAIVTNQIPLSPVLARQVIDLAKQGDQVAGEIVAFSARELGSNVNAVIRQLNFRDLTFDLVLIGSVFKAGEIYFEPFRCTVNTFAPGANFVHLSVPPVAGSILLASEAAGHPITDIKQQLLHSLQTYFEGFWQKRD